MKNSSLFDNSTTDRENDPEPDVSFVQPKYVQKKLKKQEARRKGIIMGTAANSHRIKGAPEPDRHLFIYRMGKETDDDALRDFGTCIRSLDCISKPQFKFKSYKLTVPVSQFKTLFTSSKWPKGIRVRKFIPPNSNRYPVSS